MTEPGSSDPRAVSAWRWWHTLGVVVLSLVGMLVFAAYRFDRAVHRLTGGHATEFLQDPAAMMRRGISVTVYGDAPGTPRRARLALVPRDPGGDTTSIGPELRLEEALAGDATPGWDGRCMAKFDFDSLVVAIGPGRAPAASDSVPRAMSKILVMAGGQEVGSLSECEAGDDQASD